MKNVLVCFTNGHFNSKLSCTIYISSKKTKTKLYSRRVKTAIVVLIAPLTL